MPRELDIQDFDYLLPEERIARFPLEERDSAKLLVYRRGEIATDTFRHLGEQLPEGAHLVFNDTRVVHARLRFRTESDKPIEVFCLEPLSPDEHQRNLSHGTGVEWLCLIGNNRAWKSGPLTLRVDSPQGQWALQVERLERRGDAFAVRFEWSPGDKAFGEVLALAGVIPLPPYLNRESTAADHERYQTVYARHEGSVAAPTAGLHFTERVFADLDARGIQRSEVTLHVGAGTFKPVKSETLEGHEMHTESLLVPRQALLALRSTLEKGAPVIAVGTTSLRTLESVYWFGAALHQGRPFEGHLSVSQWQPYETLGPLPSARESLTAILDALDARGLDALEGHTQILLAPGYTFRLADGLITNFHQPKSTLILLVAALIGEDWRRVYGYALDNGFRFLSYGDSSLLLKPVQTSAGQ
jgi:S-adenosylmethionine:tRNA ribosyltransferase-isomerase